MGLPKGRVNRALNLISSRETLYLAQVEKLGVISDLHYDYREER